MEPPGTIEGLLTALDRQRELYRKLFAQAVRQRDALRVGDAGVLIEVVEEKQRLLAGVEKEDLELSPWRKCWAEVRERFAPAERARVDALVGQVEEVLRALLALEEECTRMVEAGMAAADQELKRVAEARKLRSAYRPGPPAGEARFLDRTE